MRTARVLPRVEEAKRDALPTAPQSTFVIVVLGYGRLLVEEVCEKRKRANGGYSGWLSLLPKRSRTKDDDEDEDDYANRPRFAPGRRVEEAKRDEDRKSTRLNSSHGS